MKKTSLPLIGCCGLLVLLSSTIAATFAATAAAAEIVPTPRALGLPVTLTNRPWLAAAMAQEPVNLAARGYTEEEFLVSGTANA
ncbi:MAG: alpha/beta hydrolase domain-containing protein, partial [Pseudomonadota bacterium]